MTMSCAMEYIGWRARDTLPPTLRLTCFGVFRGLGLLGVLEREVQIRSRNLPRRPSQLNDMFECDVCLPCLCVLSVRVTGVVWCMCWTLLAHSQ